METDKTLSIPKTCPICNGPNYRGNLNDEIGLQTPELYEAACIALRQAGLTPAEGETDEDYYDSLEAGAIDPWRVCWNCKTDNENNLFS